LEFGFSFYNNNFRKKKKKFEHFAFEQSRDKSNTSRPINQYTKNSQKSELRL